MAKIPDPIKVAVDINININRVELASEDPDRFIFGLIDVFKNKTGSKKL